MGKELDALTKGLVKIYAGKLDEQEQIQLAEAMQVLAHDKKYNKFKNFFPDTGKYRFKVAYIGPVGLHCLAHISSLPLFKGYSKVFQAG